MYFPYCLLVSWRTQFRSYYLIFSIFCLVFLQKVLQIIILSACRYKYWIILTNTTFPFEIHFLIFIEIGFLHFFQHRFNILVKSCLIHRRMGEFWARTHFFKIWSYRNYLFLLSVGRLLKKGDKIRNVRLTLYHSLNTQSCNRRPLSSTFTFENVRSPKKNSIFIPKKISKIKKEKKIYFATF